MAVFILQQQRQHSCRKIMITFGWCEDSYTFFFSERRSISVFPSIRSLECKRAGVTVLHWGGGNVSQNTFPGETRKEGMYLRRAQKSSRCSAHLQWLLVCICTLQFSREWETSGSCWLGCYWCCELFQNCWIWRTSQCFSGTGKSVSKHFWLPPVSHVAHFCCGPGYIL